MGTTLRWLVVIALLLIAGFAPLPRDKALITVGSKKFTESVILGEMLKIIGQDSNVTTTHLAELGGTRIVYEAVKNGEVDMYVEYTGTIEKELFKDQGATDRTKMEALLLKDGIRISQPIGFQNTYALGMLRSRAEELGLEKISDLKQHPSLRCGFSNEFVERGDAWPSLRKAYNLPQTEVVGLDHDLAYRQLELGAYDIVDVYTTDAKIKTLDLKVLEDDLNFFPRYDAVLLYRDDFPKRFPQVFEQLSKLEGAISIPEMVRLNELADSGQAKEAQIAAGFLKESFGIEFEADEESRGAGIWRNTVDHLELVRRSLIPAILIAVPLGIFSAKYNWLGQIVLGITGIIQTIPSLALLALLLPFANAIGLSSVGSGSATAIMALFLYSLLPIVRNTYTGLKDIDKTYHESAIALGLTRFTRLIQIELPLAMRSILSGIKTAAVMNIGFATLGALIGAGGYGQPILTGIRLFNRRLIYEGAIPAALLAILVLFAFELLERKIVSRGLRLKSV